MIISKKLHAAVAENTLASPFKESGAASNANVYDYVFAGCGCAALSLLIHLKEAGLLQGKKVLVIDKDAKKSNDRTWCFWEKEAGVFEPVVYKSWQGLSFYSHYFSGPLHIAPYTYKLIRGIDFYNHCFAQLKEASGITWLQADVAAVNNGEQGADIEAGGQTFRGKIVFNSIMPQRPQLKRHEYWLLQHFKGWIVETEKHVFHPENATLMDFRVSQEAGCAFVYVLPFSRRKALVEYTLFSKALLPQEAYDAALANYLQRYLHISDYSVSDTEFGVIPMTNFSFPQRNGAILNIGTAGGYTKASSGYTFRAIQKNAARIVTSLHRHGHPFAAAADASRFHFYDSVLLHILHLEKMEGAKIFAQLFQKNRADSVLKFLDNDTHISEELPLISSLPIFPFTKAAIAYLMARANGK